MIQQITMAFLNEWTVVAEVTFEGSEFHDEMLGGKSNGMC